MDETFYGKGIAVTSGFDLSAESPLDTREVVNTIEERDSHVINHRAYEGMIVYVKETKTTYQYVDGEWKEFGVNVNGDSGGGGNCDCDNNNNATGGGSGGHIDVNPPEDTSQIWVDTSVPNKIAPTTYENRLKLKYIEMLNLVTKRMVKVNEKISLINTKISQISSSDHENEKNNFYTQLTSVRNEYTRLQFTLSNTLLIMDTSDLETIKTTSQKLRKDVKALIYNLLDFLNDVMILLDNERGIIVPGGGEDTGGDNDDNDEPSITIENSLLTENGMNILTEDGLLLIVDILSTPDDALMTENGFTLLTEDGRMILADGIEASEIIVDAILTELNQILLTEDGKQILKG